LVGKRLPNAKKGVSKELYIDELNDYSALQNKKIIGIDPGKSDLIYCVDDASKDANVFRYSQDQRRKETKMKKYNNIILGMKTNKIQGKSVIMTKFNSLLYLQKYDGINSLLPYYPTVPVQHQHPPAYFSSF
jgi:hypothetical protein